MWSFREGLSNETSSRSRHQPKENAQNRLVYARRFYIEIVKDGYIMDKLLECAKCYEKLLDKKYHMIVQYDRLSPTSEKST
jgi:hypothetical protein